MYGLDLAHELLEVALEGHVYSCRARGERKKREAKCQVSNIEPLPERSQKPSLSWAACIKRIYEIDPLECPKCKSQMRIVAFVQDLQDIKKIMRSLGLPDSTVLPPLPKSSTAEFEQYCLDDYRASYSESVAATGLINHY